MAEGLLEVRPGLGTLVAERWASSAAALSKLLQKELEQLVVEAKKLGLNLADVAEALERHWNRLETPEPVVRSKT